jgi:hypothetical protein
MKNSPEAQKLIDAACTALDEHGSLAIARAALDRQARERAAKRREARR